MDGRTDLSATLHHYLPTYSMSRHAVSVSVRPSLGLACMNNMKNRGLLFQDSYLLSCSHLTSSSFHFPDAGDTLSPLSSVLYLNALSLSLPACSCFPVTLARFRPWSIRSRCKGSVSSRRLNRCTWLTYTTGAACQDLRRARVARRQ